MSLYKINNVELEIDMEDADFLKNYEDAFNQMEKEEKELQKVGMNSEFMFGYCELFYHLFDHIFGEGTAEKLFNGKHNVRVTDEVYNEFITICTEQARTANQRRNKLVQKYQPKKRK